MDKKFDQLIFGFLKEKYIEDDSFKNINIMEGFQIFIKNKTLYARPGTVKAYKDVLKPVLNYFNLRHIFMVDDITQDVIDTYVEFRLNTVKDSTINKEMGNLLTFLNFLLKYGYITRIKFTYKRFKVDPPHKDPIKEESIEKILKYFSTCKYRKTNMLAFLLILTTGIRSTELIYIANKNIDIEHHRILLEVTKNKQPRYIYFTDDLIPLIEEVKSDKFYLLNNNDGSQMTLDGLRDFFKHIKARLNIDVLSPRKLRHYYATHLYLKTLNLYLVSKMLGHQDIHTTEKYLDLEEQYKAENYELFNPIEGITFSKISKK